MKDRAVAKTRVTGPQIRQNQKKVNIHRKQIMLLVAPQIFEASYGIVKEQKKRSLTSFMPSSRVTSPKQPGQSYQTHTTKPKSTEPKTTKPKTTKPKF